MSHLKNKPPAGNRRLDLAGGCVQDDHVGPPAGLQHAAIAKPHGLGGPRRGESPGFWQVKNAVVGKVPYPFCRRPKPFAGGQYEPMPFFYGIGHQGVERTRRFEVIATCAQDDRVANCARRADGSLALRRDGDLGANHAEPGAGISVWVAKTAKRQVTGFKAVGDAAKLSRHRSVWFGLSLFSPCVACNGPKGRFASPGHAGLNAEEIHKTLLDRKDQLGYASLERGVHDNLGPQVDPGAGTGIPEVAQGREGRAGVLSGKGPALAEPYRGDPCSSGVLLNLIKVEGRGAKWHLDSVRCGVEVNQPRSKDIAVQVYDPPAIRRDGAVRYGQRTRLQCSPGHHLGAT